MQTYARKDADTQTEYTNYLERLQTKGFITMSNHSYLRVIASCLYYPCNAITSRKMSHGNLE